MTKQQRWRAKNMEKYRETRKDYMRRYRERHALSQHHSTLEHASAANVSEKTSVALQAEPPLKVASVEAEQKLRSLRDTYLRYAGDFACFCREVLGYQDMNQEHQALCRFLQSHEKTNKLILMPRYSFKSCIATVGYALWRLTLNDSLRILIYSDAVARSEAFLTDLKNHILALKPGSRFRELYGAWEVDPKKGVWNQSAIVIAPRQSAYAEPSVDTAGLESSKVGAHYDLILIDDLVTKENTTTPELLEKVYTCYKASRSLLRPGGEVLVIGTRWHFGDMYGRLLAENEQTRQFAVFLRDAVVSEGRDYPFASIGLTKDFLEEQRQAQGSYLFSCLYRLAPQDEATAIFKAADFAFYDLASRPARERLYITCCIDPAISQGADADETALTVVGTDAQMNLYLLDMVAGHLLPDQMVDELFDLHAHWQFQCVGIETNAFQKMLKRDIEQRIAKEREASAFRLFSLVEFTGTAKTSKDLRIRGLQPYHERGAIKFPGTRLETLENDWSVLAFQMLQFPHGAHDDRLDSLAYHLQIMRKGSEQVIPTEVPYTSAAWWERECRKREIVAIARQPRWNRPPLPQLAFS